MRRVDTKPETIVKRRMINALDKFRTLYGREIGNEEFVDERRMSGYRAKISGPTRFCCGQATYEGPEGTWLCWMNKAGNAISGTPWKKSDDLPLFGAYEEYPLVGEQSNKGLYELLSSGKKDLVFKATSGLTIVIGRVANQEVKYEVVWRNENEKRLHTTFYTGLDAFEEIREGEGFNLSKFRIVDSYNYEGRR
jgi:hypothetical protein